MKAATFRGEKNIELGERPDPTIQNPTDAIVALAP
jgi:hypothetical protein